MSADLVCCRLCLFNTTEYWDLFNEQLEPNEVQQRITKYLHLNIKLEDSYSKIICTNCLVRLNEFHSYSINVESNQNILLELSQQTHTTNQLIDEQQDQDTLVESITNDTTSPSVTLITNNDGELIQFGEFSIKNKNFIISLSSSLNCKNNEIIATAETSQDLINNQLIVTAGDDGDDDDDDDDDDDNDDDELIQSTQSFIETSQSSIVCLEISNDIIDGVVINNDKEQKQCDDNIEKQEIINSVNNHQSLILFTPQSLQLNNKDKTLLQIDNSNNKNDTIVSNVTKTVKSLSKITKKKSKQEKLIVCKPIIQLLNNKNNQSRANQNFTENIDENQEDKNCDEIDNDNNDEEHLEDEDLLSDCEYLYDDIVIDLDDNGIIDEKTNQIDEIDTIVGSDEDDDDDDLTHELYEPNEIFAGFPKVLFKNAKFLLRGHALMKLMASFFRLECDLCAGNPFIGPPIELKTIKKFTNLTELFKHFNDIHLSDGYVICCGLKIKKLRNMAMHMAKHLQPTAFTCNICNKIMTCPQILKYHMRNHLPESERPLACKVCPRKFSYGSALSAHISTTHQTKIDKIFHICDECGKSFSSAIRLASHLKSHSNPTQEYICHICAKQFYNQSNLIYHLTTHQPKIHQVQCDECKKWLKNKLCLRKHMVQHSQVRYSCKRCNYSTLNPQCLRNHERVQHSDIKPFSCQICNKTFKLRNTLLNHMAQHTGERKFSCEFCGRKFVSGGNYYSHRKRMHPNELAAVNLKKEADEKLLREKTLKQKIKIKKH